MSWLRVRILFLLLLIFIISVSFIHADNRYDKAGEVHMKLTSPEFNNNGIIPVKFTCEGQDINPALVIEDIPAGAKSLALIMDDPDAPMGTWVHWVVYNIPVISRIDEDSIPGEQGINTAGREKYHGPCPPSGTHRYFFKIYALDAELSLKPGFNKQGLEKAIEGHLLQKAELVGLYKKT
ncbi:MAG: YbhB/YbcL family Raf kinase inhibitor-like protein [Candidatus Omnitrophota bacterium]